VARFAMRFQQFTGPIMAKGFEDTALYIYNRLISQNTIGGSPESSGTTLEEFHQANLDRKKLWPHSLNASSTHDTKRGEDSTARINVLSEMPEEWETALKSWSKLSEGLKRKVNGSEAPDRNEEYFLYQAILGSLPFQEGRVPFSERIEEYMVKSLREAKVHSCWSEPDTSYEQAVISFVRGVIRPENDNRLLGEILQFYDQVQEHGIQNSLSQALIKMTSPGVPDFYQGTELYDFSFVDPDNRRPVDFQKRIVALDEISRRERGDVKGLAEDLLASKADGRVKLFLIHRVLQARRSCPGLFSYGSYLPLQTEGILGNHIVAFARALEGRWAVTVAPRLTAKLGPRIPLSRAAWEDARIMMPDDFPRHWRDAITSREIESDDGILLSDVLEAFPAALLMGGEWT
jgi:(1->4)-alpha-D-glucan 1-alpha-D-glucosylmutase